MGQAQQQQQQQQQWGEGGGGSSVSMAFKKLEGSVGLDGNGQELSASKLSQAMKAQKVSTKISSLV